MASCGEYGGRVLRPFKGFGVAFIQGATLTPETVKNWPLANKRALHENGTVEWYGPPSEAEAEVREAGKENKAKGTSRRSAPAEKPAEKTSAPAKAAPRRRTR